MKLFRQLQVIMRNLSDVRSVSDVSMSLLALNELSTRINKIANVPTVVCLCGSTKFKDAFIKANFDLTMRGNIVLSVGWFSHVDRDVFFPSDEEKVILDALHKRKIDIADEIFVINVEGYIGESTRSEIDYAVASGKPVKFLEN